MTKPVRNEQLWEEFILAQALFAPASEYSAAAKRYVEALMKAEHLDRDDIAQLSGLLIAAVLFGRSTPNG